MDYANLPKIELHLHLDCSVSYEVVKHLNPKITQQVYESVYVVPSRCHDLSAYLDVAAHSTALLQNREALRLVTLDLLKQLAADHVIYAEVRFAPFEHIKEGLAVRKVVEIVNDALAEGIAQTGVQAGLLLCTLRHYNEGQSLKTAQLVADFSGSHVVGLDLASDEANHTLREHISAFQFAREHKLLCTAHAGEARGPKSVWETLNKLGVRRIGHGVRSVEDPTLLAHLRQENIHLEVCPTSNVRTAVADSMKDHPIQQLFENGISLSVNTDARDLLDLTLTQEYENLAKSFGWTPAHFHHCNSSAIEHAFASDSSKVLLQEQIDHAYGRL